MTAEVLEDPEAEVGADWACRVNGEPLGELPTDLYIPPDALEIFLESFEGPLDLLLYLIRRQNLDILAIPIAEITRQYMAYIEVMQALRLELAGEYLVMAALLAEIKSRMLLPRPPSAGDDDEEDPRLALIRQLQEYERFKTGAQRLDALPRLERDYFHASASRDALSGPPAPAPALEDLLDALAGVLRRASLSAHHQISAEALSVRERMTRILEGLDHDEFVDFVSLLVSSEGRPGVVVAFLAVLELSKAGLLEWGQGEPFGPIRVRRRQAEDAA
ncbi:segregation and condensation protein A [Thioalkalivibrio paradoxus]|uniref:Segregation and condensation protein A n=1 Tax=Thioalkalivibrio paradoxus ARh 1 TaxID=713585 RepID=W0DN98_9GAMM|nr:ScpA family protein [Thioalkalivibrio paradoxus]AHE98468.1 chromosome segregation protein ScpA [Thioalkalivibrio paradoxus ARh 1]